jgi:hemerythrin
MENNLTAEQLKAKREAIAKAHKDADRHFALITNYMRRFNYQKMSEYEKKNLKDIKESINFFLMNDFNR